jgi:hypothetical protein
MILVDGINTPVAVHDNGILRECDLMRCGRRSIKSKNRDKKREGDAEREREREKEREREREREREL